MIDQLCILFSLGMVVLVIARAAMLDSKRPWFERDDEAAPTTDPAARPMRRPPNRGGRG